MISSQQFVLYRYPDEEKHIFLEEQGGERFHFAGFKNRIHIILHGSSVKLTNELDIPPIQLMDNTCKIISREDYNGAFSKYQDALEKNEVDKAILSRIIHQPICDIDIVSIFHTLCRTYPTAFVYAASLEDGGVWIGASPERLMQYKNGEAKTVALAGTKDTDDPSMWGKKEKDEHRAVEKYIENIGNEKFRLIEKSPIYFKQAGSIFHQKSDFTFHIAEENILSFLEALHPTPAVCGVPLEASRSLIEDAEKHDRALYTGYLGLQKEDAKGKSQYNLYVNLRCMQITSSGAYIYVGGGITIDSKVEDEWHETEAKAQTMMLVL